MNMMTNLDFSYQFGYLDASFDLSFKILASAHIGFNHALDTIYFARQSSAFDEVRDDFLDANNVLEKGKWFVLLYHDQLYIFTGNHSQIFYFENIDLMEYNKNERVYQLEVATMSYYQFFNCQKLWDNDFSSSELGKMEEKMAKPEWHKKEILTREVNHGMLVYCKFDWKLNVISQTVLCILS